MLFTIFLLGSGAGVVEVQPIARTDSDNSKLLCFIDELRDDSMVY